MMDIFASCKFSDISGEQKNRQIKSLDQQSNVSELRRKVVELFGIHENEFDLVYCGRYMRDCLPLSTYRVSDGCTIHVMKRVHHPIPSADPLDDGLIAQVLRAMKQIVKAPASRRALERVVANPDTLKKLISVTPSLASDPVAMAIFQNRDMLILSTVADKETMNRMLTAHPSLCHAALHLASTINEEVLKEAASGNLAANQSVSLDSRVHYGLDLMSDEEEDDDDEAGGVTQPGLPPRAAPGAPAASTAAAHPITADFFRQAMQVIYSGSAVQQQLAGAPSGATMAPQQQQQTQQLYQVSEAQLEQLRDMGIMDERVARRALERAGGDIGLALEYIFGDDSMS